MSNFFGGGFTAPPSSQCKLRQPAGPFQQQPALPIASAPIPAAFPNQAFTQPARMLGASMPAAAPQPQPQYQARAYVLPVMEPAHQGPQMAQAQPQDERAYVQAPGPMGPRSYPVMKKGEAPCPICRG